MQAIELGAVPASLAGHVLLGLDAELLLGVLALLDATQLVLAIGELLGRALAFALGLGLAATQIGELALERLHRRLDGIGPRERRGLAGTGAAGASLGEHVAFELTRRPLVRRCLVVSLGNHASLSVCARPDTLPCTRVPSCRLRETVSALLVAQAPGHARLQRPQLDEAGRGGLREQPAGLREGRE